MASCSAQRYCVGTQELIARPTSSGSVLLMHNESGACCPAAFSVLVKHRRSAGGFNPWTTVVPLIGRRLPLEVLVSCSQGCMFQLSSLNVSTYAAAHARAFARSRKLSDIVLLEGQLDSALSNEVTTPPCSVPLPLPPRVRLSLVLHPPLVAPLYEAAKGFLLGVITELTSEHNHINRERFSLVEVSSTGALILFDLMTEIIDVRVSGPDVRECAACSPTAALPSTTP